MDYIERDDLVRSLVKETNELATSKGRLEWFQCTPLHPLTIHEADDPQVVLAKQRANGVAFRDITAEPRLDLGELYMQRYATADDFVRLWAEQGWTTLRVRRTHMGYQQPKYLQSYRRVLRALPQMDPWTSAGVEDCWSYVFATQRPEDIEHFRSLQLPVDRITSA